MVFRSQSRPLFALVIAPILFLAGTAEGDDTSAGWVKHPGNPVLGDATWELALTAKHREELQRPSSPPLLRGDL